jgi:hypothetical protein
MGFFTQNTISSAGKFLVSKLKEKGIVDTNSFFDGTQELNDKLIKEFREFGLGDEEIDESVAGVCIDLAATQLEAAGYVEMKYLGSLTACESSHRFEIEFSSLGKRVLSDVENFQFKAVDL